MSIAVERDQEFLEAIRGVAAQAAAHADEVDRDARFPVEALQAMKDAGALAAFVPGELGGAGVSFEAIAEACFELGRHCGAAAMVFAMHQIQVVTLVRHLDGSEAIEGYLRDLVGEQRLIASITSEMGTGGDMSKSVAALTEAGDGWHTFEKQAPTVSYGNHADDFLTTLRRSPAAEPGDQVVALTRRDDMELDQNGTWDPLGMRGTCSPGFVVRARVAPGFVLPAPFSRIAPESMVPVSHILWSHLWLGIATEAFDRARAFVRAAAKRTPGETPPSAVRLSYLLGELTPLRAQVASGLQDFLEASADEASREQLSSFASVLRFNGLKTSVADQAPRICQGAMGVCGIMGFKNDSPFSVGRHLRDSMSACLMVANERIHQTNAGLLLVAKEV
jgi:acyl-CoA dehydrogenase